jgi:hypothetical protein
VLTVRADPLGTAALKAGNLPGEDVVGGVRCPLADLLAASGEDLLSVVELCGGDDRFVGLSDVDVATLQLGMANEGAST